MNASDQSSLAPFRTSHSLLLHLFNSVFDMVLAASVSGVAINTAATWNLATASTGFSILMEHG